MPLPAASSIPQGQAHTGRQLRGSPGCWPALEKPCPRCLQMRGPELFAGGFKGPEDGGKWGRRCWGHRGSSGGTGAGGSVPAAAAGAPGHRLRPLAFPLCQLFYFRLVAPRQGILSEPWETQKGGRWVCAAPARPSAALGCPPAPGRGAHPGWQARSPTRRSPFPWPHPFPGLRVPSRIFPTCDPVGLLDLIPQKQFADVKPWQRPKRAARGSPRPWEGGGERCAG